MKTRFFILGAIFTFLSLGARGQVVTMYEQGFEENEAQNYWVSPEENYNFSTDYQTVGARSIRLLQSRTDDVVFVTDTIDFRSNTSRNFVSLFFDHMCNIETNSGSDDKIGIIEVKLARWSDNDYRMLTGTEYNKDREGYSTEFNRRSTFNRESYDDWGAGNVSNAKWKSERFDINDILTASVPTEDRLLIFRFKLKKRTRSGNVPNNVGWWIDNLRVRASQNQMVTPKLKMVLFPDGGAHPSSRGARIMLDARTDVPQGIADDSVYMYYKVGDGQTEERVYMQSQGSFTGYDDAVWTRFSGRVPFCGYDTVMYFRCVVKDATVNHNEVTYPLSSGAWVKYWCVRGVECLPETTPSVLNGNEESSLFPFIQFADTRSEWVIDSLTLKRAGYGPGAITDFNFVVAQNVQEQSRPNYQFRFKNVPYRYSVPSADDAVPFTSDYMHAAFDGTLTIPQTTSGNYLTVHLTDTFFYAGSGIVVQAINNGTTNPTAVKLKMANNATTRKSKYYYGKSANYGANAYIDPEMMTSSFTDVKRPVMVLKSHKNQQLIYDAGVAGLAFPNFNTPIVEQPSHVDVILKNFGVQTINSVVVNYSIDGGDTVSSRWTGTLAGGDTTVFTVGTGVTLEAGFHNIVAWTSDTLTVGTALIRDHEPLNNASNVNNPDDVSFIVCTGPMSGVINVGGENADYNNMYEFLLTLSRCGVDDSLVVKLCSDSIYGPFVMPAVFGTTEEHYVVFEPSGERVKFVSDGGATPYIANMAEASNVHLRNIDFVRRSGALTNMVVLGINSNDCHFEGCTFTDSASSATSAIEAMIASDHANNVYVKGCTVKGGNKGVDISGRTLELRSTGATVERCYFSGQGTSAVQVQYMDNVSVQKNEMYDVASNTSYVLMANGCYGNVRIMANKIYTTHGAGALGVGKLFGTQDNRAIVANNMLVTNDDGTANQMSSTLNVIDGDWVDVVYNSVKMTADNRPDEMVAAVIFGNPALTNSRFVNNIVTCYDSRNYALTFGCYGQPSNTIGHNIYYTVSPMLNRRGTTLYQSIEQWQAAVPMDETSVSLNPTFLNGSLVDLRTFNRLVKGIGMPLTTVTTDMFDSVRNGQQTCPGAFEFVSLYYDFELEALVSPEADRCDMPEDVELVVLLRNSGSSAFVPGSGRSLAIEYSINGGEAATCQVTRTIPANDTITIHTGQMLHLPVHNVLWDSVYNFRMWTSSTSDPNQTNDTTTFTVVKHYRQPAAGDYSQGVPFFTAATTTVPDSVLTEWAVYDDPAAPKRQGQVKWYSARDEASYLQDGKTITTDVLRRDTNLYFRQHRELPIVRITQVMARKTATSAGLTSPAPAWLKSTGALVAVQLTNVGDAPAYLQNDTLALVSTETGLKKQIKFDNSVVIQPGEFLVVQFTTEPSEPVAGPTVYAPSASITSSATTVNMGVVYRHAGKIEDAVAMNSVMTATSTNWPQNVPSYVWNGTAGVAISVATSCGIVRTGFSGTANDWRLATNDNRMFIGSIDPSWLRYVDNGCQADFSTAHLYMIAAPTVDIELTPTELPSGCALGLEDVTVMVSNYGIQPVNNLVLNYTAGGTVVSETLTTPVGAAADTLYTFNTKLNMVVPYDSTFNVTVYATMYSSDTNRANDTCRMSAFSRYTAGMPNMQEPVTSQYGEPATLTHMPTENAMPVWYDMNGNVLDTTYTHVTPPLYSNDSVMLGYLAMGSITGQIGDATTTTVATGNDAYPSPYSPTKKFARQQFIYTAAELNEMGMNEAGSIFSVAFNLATVPTATTMPVVFTNYYISMGQTDKEYFTGNKTWAETELVYSRQNFTLTSSDEGTWVEHQFDTPFMWDGVSSIVVEVAFERDPAVTSGLRTGYTETSDNTTLFKVDNSNLSGGVLGYTGTGTRKKRRPNIRINHSVLGCPGPQQKIHINLIGIPEYDASLNWPAGSDTLSYNSCGVAMDVIVGNRGVYNLSNYTLKYSIDGGPYISHPETVEIAPLTTHVLQLLNMQFVAGRHHIDAVIIAAGDTITSNDTIHRDFSVRFCGTYSIGNGAEADYSSITEVVDTLNAVGVGAPVVFNLAAGNYNEKIYLHDVIGSSATNTISFVGESDSTTLLTAATASGTNYVMKLDNVANVTFSKVGILSRPTSGSYSNVIVASNISDRLAIENCLVRVKGSVTNVNGSCVVLEGNVAGLTIQNSWIDSGWYSVRYTGNNINYRNVLFNNNRITNFAKAGIFLRGVENIEITKTDLISSRSDNTRGLQGISLTDVTGTFTIQKNHIYLVDQTRAGKQGIFLDGVKNTSIQRGYIINNMVSVYGRNTTDATVAPPSAIYMRDCENVNVLFNSLRTEFETDTGSRALCIDISDNGASRGIQVLNNILANFSSYAYYVTRDTLVSVSNYNDYYTEGQTLAKWGNNACTNLAILKARNSKDANSISVIPYFEADDDLHLRLSDLVDKAQYNPDVIDDIDDRVRSQFPRPTIGAHEVAPVTSNLSVVKIIEPAMPTSLDFDINNLPPNIETDSVLVKIEVYNNGLIAVNNATWYAYIEGHDSVTMSNTMPLGSIGAGQFKTVQLRVPTIMGLIDTQSIHVVIICPEDPDTSDNQMSQKFYIAPAFNLKAEMIRPDRTGCTLYDTPVTITVKNEGFKPIPANYPFEIGYFAQAYKTYNSSAPNNNKLEISTFPDTVRDTVTLLSPLPITATRNIRFNTHANFYPTDTMANIKVAIYGWCRLDVDVSFDNDSTAKPARPGNESASGIFDSYFSPMKPVGVDTTLPYGTTGPLHASQGNARPIRWHRDSTQAYFYAPANDYVGSCTWDTTPVFFRDTVFYLQSFSNSNPACPSYFGKLEVHIMPRKENDIAFSEVLAPLGRRVYMENDTVRVRIANYGTQSQQNFPITYQMRRRNAAPLMTVTEMFTEEIGPGQVKTFTFDSLIQIPNPTVRDSFYLRIWTGLETDEVPNNDTIRLANRVRSADSNDITLDYKFYTLRESTYPTCVNTLDPPSDSIDIIRIAYNDIDVDMPALGRAYNNFGPFNNRLKNAIHVTRGTTDTLIIVIANPSNSVERDRGRVTAFIDFNRSGTFGDPGECVVTPVSIYTDSTYRVAVTIPQSASYGYMKMRVMASVYNYNLANQSPRGSDLGSSGHVVDFLLHVDPEDKVSATDISLPQIVSPRSNLIRDTLPRVVSFRMVNKGSQPLTNTVIHYTFEQDSLNSFSDDIVWTGNLQPGRSTVVSLPSYNFPDGTSQLRIWHDTPADTNHHNDTLIYEYHRFHTIYLVMDDNFDSIDMWYAPTGYNDYTRNYWQRGTPQKPSSSYFYANSEPNSWVTSLESSNIKSGSYGNLSYLYSPIIDISQIRPDTISFDLVLNTLQGANAYVEYYSYRRLWEKLEKDSLPTWYNNYEDNVFTGTFPWTRRMISVDSLRTNFNEKMQFRIVYNTPQKTNNPNFGAGVAIDNFHIGRGRQRIDAGLVAITYPVEPKFGQTIYPEVVVKNFGYDTLRTLEMGYTYPGVHLAPISNVSCHIAPGETDTIAFPDPFVVTSDFPDTFSITAFTNLASIGDIYRDNDTITKVFVLSPLGGDIALDHFRYPLDNVVAGDSIEVTVRVRNAGLSPISNATLSYTVGSTHVSEEVDIVQLLDAPLAYSEEFNYTFHNKFHASMGSMTITADADCDSNEYHYNDIITKRIKGITAITDVAAAAIVVDTSDLDAVSIQLVVDNRGSRGVNNFRVGFWYDGDSINKRTDETFYRAAPLPALSSTTHIFDVALPHRAGGYRDVTAYVHFPGDNDPSNDTTNKIVRQYIDIEALGLVVEENANPDCRVFMRLRNLGNTALSGKTIHMRANVNGNDIATDVVRRIDPGDEALIEFNRTIPKSPLRKYAGSGSFVDLPVDANPDNNQTTKVTVVNYVEGIPTVNADAFVLGQNYPNPFSGTTTVPFTLPKASDVSLFVMDAMGKMVYTARGFFQAGDNIVTLNLDKYSSGVYYYGIIVDGKRQMRKLILK